MAQTFQSAITLYSESHASELVTTTYLQGLHGKLISKLKPTGMAVALPRLTLSTAVPAKSKEKMAVASSVDTKQRLPYNPRRTKPSKLQSKTLTNFTPAILTSDISVSDLLKRSTLTTTTFAGGIVGDIEKTYLGYERWMPSPPKVEKPRSVFNAASLAYIGDCIYELYARRHFLFPPLRIEEYNDRVMAVVRCEAQEAMLQKLINDDILSRVERDVLRWGKNVGSAKTKTKRRAGIVVYNRASSLETLIGYLYLTNAQRLEEIMLKLGFCSGVSDQSILGEIDRQK